MALSPAATGPQAVLVINEVPIWQARIQVALRYPPAKDIQIRVIKLRMPLDILLVFTLT